MSRALPEAVHAVQLAVSGVPTSTSPDVLDRYSRDESGLSPCMPELVVWPEDAAQVQALFVAANRHGVPVTPVGARTGKSGGSLPVDGGIALSLERLNRSLVVNAPDLSCRADAGVVLRRIDESAEKEGLFYPPDPNSWETCTLGGTIAENAGGPRALKYGVTRDYVLGLEWVLPTGELIEVGRRTSKGVAGYDMVGLLVGSEGTLGVCTQATLRLIPRPKVVQTALLAFADVERASFAVTRVLQGGVWPRTLELLDEVALRAVAGQGLPVGEGTGAVVLAEVDGLTAEATFAELTHLCELCTQAGAHEALVAQDAHQREQLWRVRRMVSPALRAMGPKKLSEDVVVPRSALPQAIARFKQAGLDAGLVVATYGHAGDGNLHANVLFRDDSQRPQVAAVLDAMMRITLELGGTITGEHGVGLAKKPFLPLEQSQALLELQRKIQVVFDPRGVMNPGKVFAV